MESNTSNRSRLIAKNILVSFVTKGWSAVTVLLMVPLTLKMLGVYSNGVWLTISGILMWIDFMDIGLGNGLRNAVAFYIAKGDALKVREAISSTFFMLVLIVLPLTFLLCAAIQLFNMYTTLGIAPQSIANLDKILTVAIVIACSTFILKSVGNFYMGLQLPAINNLIICIGQTLALALTFIAYLIGCKSLMIVVVINTASPLLIWIISLPYTFWIKYPQYKPSFRCVDLGMSRNLCSAGVQFFILQICGVILFTSTNIIISKMFSPAEVTPYQVVYRYFSIILVAFNTVCLPFWNATTDAYARNDIIWIKQTEHKLNLLVIGAFASLAIMLILSKQVYTVWIGDSIQIPFSLSVSMALYIITLIVSLRYSYILNGINILHIQLLFTIIATVVFLPLAWAACKYIGNVTALVCAMCLVQIPGLIANAWKYHQLFGNKKK